MQTYLTFLTHGEFPSTGLQKLISDSKDIAIDHPPEKVKVVDIGGREFRHPLNPLALKVIEKLVETKRISADIDLKKLMKLEPREITIIPRDIIWSTSKILPENVNQWAAILYSNRELLGYSNGYVSDNGDIKDNNPLSAYIAFTNIHPDYIGSKLCKPLMKFTLQQLIRKFPSLKIIKITNVSETLNGLPACLCYYRAGHDLNFKMAPEDDEKKKCFSDNPRGDYYYIRAKMIK